ncbi:MAG TPA: ABC transporter ATP-binding protein, partial [Gammaproteobacteria bacterium]|nr:ABC transporter ATP-binding protein [Gammaproteobacteria bacterium]
LSPAIKSAMSEDVFTYLLHHSHDFFQNTFSGSLTKKISDLVEIENIINIINEWFVPRLLALIIASVTLFAVVHPIFGIILFVWAILFVYFSYAASRSSENLSRIHSESAAKMFGTMSDSFTNVMSTKLFANIPSEVSNIKSDLKVLVNNDRNLQWFILKISFVQGCGVTLLTACMAITLIYGRVHGWISVGDFALVLALTTGFVDAVYGIGQQMQRFAKSVGTMNQALNFVRVPHDVINMPGALPIRIKQGEIKFQGVCFQYKGSERPLFANLNITIPPGERVGLVGYSGSGKSTFIKLILRLIDTQSGSILIDNQNIKQVTKDSLRKQVGTIPQESELFHRTIMENIRFAKMHATDDEVIAAAKLARCHEFICELPNQYQALVGERGVKLSGGQRQRIAIARAFLKNAPILLLDEATSSLDSVTERYIKESLDNLMAKKTTIVIAHRLSTLKDMDRILVFAQGKIIEDGSLDSLLKDTKCHFYKLWQMQAGGFIPSIAE